MPAFSITMLQVITTAVSFTIAFVFNFSNLKTWRLLVGLSIGSVVGWVASIVIFAFFFFSDDPYFAIIDGMPRSFLFAIAGAAIGVYFGRRKAKIRELNNPMISRGEGPLSAIVPWNDGVPPNEFAPISVSTTMPSHIPPLQEEDMWAKAADEVDGPTRRKGLWAKAFAEAQGNEAAAKVSYLQWRVEQLKNEEKMHQQQAEEAKQRAVSPDAQIINGPISDSHVIPSRVNAPDPALVEAVWKGNWNTASMLLAQGRKATGVDDEGRTLVDLATVRKDKPMLELLGRYISSN